MERIGSEIAAGMGRLGPAAATADLVRIWPAAVGADIARNAWPARITRDGTLHVTTSSSAWAFELGQLRLQLLERLREALGERAPSGLEFAVGRLPEPAGPPREESAREQVRPSAEDRRRAAAIAAGIGDDELRALVARAAAASLARARSGRSF